MVFRIRAIIWHLYHSKLVFIPWLTSVFTIVTMVHFYHVYHGNTCSNSPWYKYHDKLWFLYHGINYELYTAD